MAFFSFNLYSKYMKKLFVMLLLSCIGSSFISCREDTEQKTQADIEAIGKDIEYNTKNAGEQK